MRSAPALLLALALVVLVGCGSTETPYDTNTAVPSGDPQFPPLGASWVIDKAGVVSQSAVKQADAICQKLQDDGLAEMVIVMIRGVKHPDTWATHYGRWLKLGKKGPSTEGGNNGVVWLIRPDAQDKMTISVGRGLPRLTSTDYGHIMDEANEYFNFNNYDRGILVLAKGTDHTIRSRP